jgi:hypothetical protein
MNLLYALSDSPYADINGTKLATFRVRPKLLDNFFDWFYGTFNSTGIGNYIYLILSTLIVIGIIILFTNFVNKKKHRKILDFIYSLSWIFVLVVFISIFYAFIFIPETLIGIALLPLFLAGVSVQLLLPFIYIIKYKFFIKNNR